MTSQQNYVERDFIPENEKKFEDTHGEAREGEEAKSESEESAESEAKEEEVVSPTKSSGQESPSKKNASPSSSFASRTMKKGLSGLTGLGSLIDVVGVAQTHSFHFCLGIVDCFRVLGLEESLIVSLHSLRFQCNHCRGIRCK